MYAVHMPTAAVEERARDNEVAPELVARPKVVDLFAGAGGLSLGAARAGFDVVAAVECDPYACETHKRNFPSTKHVDKPVDENFSAAALLDGIGLEVEQLHGLIGGPPCQGFSAIGKRSATDVRNDLFAQFFRLVEETRPAFFFAENVPGILEERYNGIREAAYARLPGDYVCLEPFLVKASDYGAPTTRTRVIFVGYRPNEIDELTREDFLPPDGTQSVKVKQALRGLPVEIDPEWQSEEDGWQRLVRANGVPRVFRERLRGVVPPGIGDAEAIRKLQREKMVSGCLGTRHAEYVANRYAALRAGERDAVSKATRLDPDSYCPTIRAGTGSDKGSYQAVRPIHPEVARVITPREAARLQGFPDWFVFHSTKWHSFRQIGNSVSPILAEHLLSRIRRSLFI